MLGNEADEGVCAGGDDHDYQCNLVCGLNLPSSSFFFFFN